MAKRIDETRKGRATRPSSPSRVATRARDRVHQVPLTRKILMTVMVLGAMTTAVGAGTFASYNATVTDASATFQTGSLALSDQVASGNTCFSNGTTASNGGTGTSTDLNANANCDLIFDAASATPNATDTHPGDNVSATVHIQNVGSVAGTLSIQSAANCSTGAAADQTAAGTTSACDTVQLALQDSSQCYWGDNMTTTAQAAYITSAPLGTATSSTVDLTTYNRFKITVNGTAHDNLQITSGTYTLTNLVTAINGQISSWATASLVQATSSPILNKYELRITSNLAGPTSSVKLNIPTTTPSATMLSIIGFMDGATATAGQCAKLTGDQDHSLTAFRATSSVTPVSLGTLSASTNRDFTVLTQVPGVIGDQAQGNEATFEFTWNLVQS